MQEYLLLFADPPMYHVSISSTNIMLDDQFTAKVRIYIYIYIYNTYSFIYFQETFKYLVLKNDSNFEDLSQVDGTIHCA